MLASATSRVDWCSCVDDDVADAVDLGGHSGIDHGCRGRLLNHGRTVNRNTRHEIASLVDSAVEMTPFVVIDDAAGFHLAVAATECERLQFWFLGRYARDDVEVDNLDRRIEAKRVGPLVQPMKALVRVADGQCSICHGDANGMLL